MTKHIKVFVNLGFLHPCIVSRDLNAHDSTFMDQNQAIIASFLAIAGGLISYTLSPAGTPPAVTIGAVHTND